jgi:hypothetical protein
MSMKTQQHRKQRCRLCWSIREEGALRRHVITSNDEWIDKGPTQRNERD